MEEKKRSTIVCSHYVVTVGFGQERLENCIQKMLKDKENNMKLKVCNSPK